MCVCVYVYLSESTKLLYNCFCVYLWFCINWAPSKRSNTKVNIKCLHIGKRAHKNRFSLRMKIFALFEQKLCFHVFLFLLSEPYLKQLQHNVVTHFYSFARPHRKNDSIYIHVYGGPQIIVVERNWYANVTSKT